AQTVASATTELGGFSVLGACGPSAPRRVRDVAAAVLADRTGAALRAVGLGAAVPMTAIAGMPAVRRPEVARHVVAARPVVAAGCAPRALTAAMAMAVIRLARPALRDPQ